MSKASQLSHWVGPHAQPVPTPVHRVLCADCGTPIVPNSANLCVACLRNTVDITEGIPKQASVSFCRNCERFLSPPTTWAIVRPESQELLAICLRKLKGLNKVRLTDAHFIWTEPHSKRLRVSLTIQKEVLTATILNKYSRSSSSCSMGSVLTVASLPPRTLGRHLCKSARSLPQTYLPFPRTAHPQAWRTKETISVKEVKDGLDFFYSQRSHALKMCEFLGGVVPIRSKASEQLLSADTHTNTANFKYTCTRTLQINPLTLCSRVGNSLHLLDPATLQVAELSAQSYWRAPFDSLATISDLVEFTVLDIEPSGSTRGKWVLADAQVALSGAFRASAAGDDDGMDYDGGGGGADQIFHTRTHLGGILQPGDAVLGYHLTHANFNSDDFAALPAHRVPDVVLVKKAYPNARKKHRTRAWRLRSIAKEAGEEGETSAARGVVGRMGGRDQKKVEEDYELFLRDLEEDTEMRGAVNLYKAKDDRPTAGSGLAGGKTRKKAQVAMDVDEGAGGNTPAAGAEVEEEAEPDFPEVKLDELLEDFDEMTLDDQEA
ncbi:NMD3-domain-containing protein [Amylocystis lapponica]|nr:NMD3-domain-containing protein [Amylocystis lapponica]